MRREASELKKLLVRSIDIDLRCFTIETLLVIAFFRNKLPEVKHSSKTKKIYAIFVYQAKMSVLNARITSSEQSTLSISLSYLRLL